MSGAGDIPPPVFAAGFGLVSSLGASLADAVAGLAAGRPAAPVFREVVPGEGWPHHPIGGAMDDMFADGVTGDCAGDCAGDDGSWHARARALIVRAMNESGALADRTAPLFLASSSINIGAIERGEASGADCLGFSERVAGWLAWQGPVFWVSTACTSALNALRSAQRMIEARATTSASAVVLGLELDNRYSAAGFGSMQLLSRQAAQPLSVHRSGLVLGEAVAVVRLLAGSARPPGAGGAAEELPWRWRLCGGANIVDGGNPAGASEEAVAAMVRQALQSAAITPADIGLVKLQAAGSPLNDLAEIRGLRQVFGTLPPLCSLKPLLGHTLGASGAAELALLLGCCAAQVWPPQGRVDEDPELAATLASGFPGQPVRYLLLVILGFGGGHAALVIEDTAAGK